MSAPAAAAKKPEVLSAADAMKLALRRKANAKLVERREQVLGLISRAAVLAPTSVAEAVGALKELDDASDELGLPLTGEAWGERLLIKKKGGGHHFDEATLASASAAYTRASTLQTTCSWHTQIEGRGTAIASAVGAFRGKGGAASKAKMIERSNELLTQACKTVHDIFSDATFRPTLETLARLGLPQTLSDDADELRRASLVLAEFGHEIAISEVTGFRAEKALTQRFRAPQTLAVLSAAHELLTRVDAAARPVAHVPPPLLAEIAEAVAEVTPLASAAQSGATDELDDEI